MLMLIYTLFKKTKHIILYNYYIYFTFMDKSNLDFFYFKFALFLFCNLF